jgi:Na+-transporting methylmalonyl-CoA/oxaloacetate decarboxylase gamma subunit
MNGEIRIPYRPKIIIFLLGIVLFGYGSVHMVSLAATNERGLILNRIIELSPQGATIFYWVISVVGIVFSALAILAILISIFSKREIVITDNEITSPKSAVSRKDITVKFSDIEEIKLQSIQSTKILTIKHASGKLSISSSMLPSTTHFEKLVLLLSSKAKS